MPKRKKKKSTLFAPDASAGLADVPFFPGVPGTPHPKGGIEQRVKKIVRANSKAE